MNWKSHIFTDVLLFILAGGCLQACRQDGFGETHPDDPETLIAQGRYLAARNAEIAAALQDPNKASWFEENTPYRLLAFTKPYDESDSGNETNSVNHPRFNRVAWEGATSDGLRFINIGNDPDKWFGFSALENETGDDKRNFVSLDFYGFTYGKKTERHPSNYPDYIELDDLPGETLPAKPLSALKRTEVVADGVLNDLMRGVLPNQNIATVNAIRNGTQSVMPFTHCFSKLRFKVLQQKDEAGVPCFKDIAVTNVTLTNTFSRGAVYLQSGKVELDPTLDPKLRRRELKLTSTANVTTEEVGIGEMLVFPSDGDALTDKMPDGYDVGLEITVTSSEKADMENFLRNTGGDPTAVTQGADGKWSGKIVKEHIIDSYTNKTLHFKPNTIYPLVIWFVKDAVRIITVVPLVEPWLPGEDPDGDQWEEQALGTPQMFDNVVWSDRNLGADHFDPTDGANFEYTAGYFFQGGRNIPYYPFKYRDGTPDFAAVNKQHFIDQMTDWGKSGFRFYPIVDKDILRMTGNSNWVMYPTGTPQISIPESMPENAYFDFMVANGNNNSGLPAEQDMHWEQGSKNQPVAGFWKIPSAREFMTIFPSTPHAGNIAFNKVGGQSQLHDWGCDGVDEPDYQMEGTDVLRVTVPYYTSDMTDGDKPADGRAAAWETLHSHRDEGTTHREKYIYNGVDGNPGNCTKYEPDGDPEPGYASVYIISRAGEDEMKLSDEFLARADNGSKKRFVVRSWGTIYAIKRIYTPQAYRMRWRTVIAKEGTMNPCIYIEICRYRCEEDDELTEANYKSYDWDHPAARIYFPVCGMGDYTGEYINFGMECVYATSDPIVNGKTNALQIKITGNNASNAFIAVVKGQTNRNFGMQIRPVGGVQVAINN